MTQPAAAVPPDLQQLVADADTGGRKLTGFAGKLIFGVAIAWSLFQLWYASPLPFVLGFGVLNDTEARSLHLALALFLGFLAYPAFKSSSRQHIPVLDWLLAIAGCVRRPATSSCSTPSLRPGPASRTRWTSSPRRSGSCCCSKPRGARSACR